MTIDLSSYGGNAQTKVRGHNLVPIPIPSATQGIWYAAINIPVWTAKANFQPVSSEGPYVYSSGTVYKCLVANGNQEPPNANWQAVGPLTDNYLLYKYSDFEQLYQPVVSLPLS